MMIARSLVLAAALFTIGFGVLGARQEEDFAPGKAGPEHQRLTGLTGTWRFSVEGQDGKGTAE